MTGRDKPRRIGLRTGMAVCFGGLVLFAVTVVLVLGIGSARRNTWDLLSIRADLTGQIVRSAVVDRLAAVEKQVDFVAGVLRRNPPADLMDVEGVAASLMTGALSATPSTHSLTLVTPSAEAIEVSRKDGTTAVRRVALPGGDAARTLVQEARRGDRPYWGPVIRHPEVGIAVINYRHPLVAGDRFLGIVAGTVALGDLSRALQSVADEFSGQAFILNSGGRVLAHPALADSGYVPTAEAPLAGPEDIDDPVLRAVAAGDFETDEDFVEDRRGQLSTEVGRHFVMIQRIEEFGAEPFDLVLTVPMADVSTELMRVLWAGVAGLAVMALAIFAALVLAKRISHPLERLAVFAERARRLDLENAGRLPPSRFREVDDAAESMNALLVALHWFETYVPKRLVARLMAQGDGAVARSEEREVTVMFTDIAGFTRLAEGMDAETTAAFLNDHFRLLATEIEATGGTIDKFIGDAVMAFWGAPEALDNHAAAAVSAAERIAQAVEADNRRRAAEGRPVVRLRVGLHTGRVVVGNIGSPDRMNYTVVGDAVNVANRLEQVGKDHEAPREVTVLASAATIAAAGTDAGRSIGEIELRGRRGRMAVHLI